MKKFTLLLLLTLLSLQAQILTSPIDVMKESYGADIEVSKKNYLLHADEAAEVQKLAQLKLDTKIYRIYTARKGDKILGYGVLVSRKVRANTAVVLYTIHDDILQTIDIIAFNEPLEYVPTTTWQEQFNNVSTEKYLQLNREIPTITGATLSARSITDGSRLAFALYNTLLKGK